MQGRLNPRTKTNKTQTNLASEETPEIIHSLPPTPSNTCKKWLSQIRLLATFLCFQNLYRQRFHDLPGTLFPGPSLRTLFFFLYLIRISLLAACFYCLSCHHCAGEESGFIFSIPSFICRRKHQDIRLRQPSLPKATTLCNPLEGGSSPVITLVALQWIYSYMLMSFIKWGAPNWTQYSASAQQRGRISSMKLLAELLPIEPGRHWALPPQEALLICIHLLIHLHHSPGLQLVQPQRLFLAKVQNIAAAFTELPQYFFR